MVINKLSKKAIWTHTIVWILLTLYLLLIDPVTGSTLAYFVGTPFLMLNYIFSYYSLSLIIYPNFWKKNYFLFGISIVIVLLFFVGFDILAFFYLLPKLGVINIYKDFTFFEIVLDHLLLFLFVFISSSSFHFNREAIERQKLQNEKEKSLIIKELNSLKNQFNAHITFNFLNFCYSNVHYISPETADAIELFSDMLRYTMRVRPNEKILVKNEIEYIESFIQLQKLLTSSVYVDFKYEGDLNTKLILPRILITFVENAFKHGNFSEEKDPILIYLAITDDYLKFKVSNKKNIQKRVVNGVGHENVKHVLELFYQDNYDLLIDEDKNYYSSELKIKL